MNIINRIKKLHYPSLSQQLGYSAKDKLVIVNTDDVGLHEDETKASLKALQYGMVKSGSIMVPCKNIIPVVEFWKKYPDIDIGVHLTLTCEWGKKYPWSPILSKNEVPGLYNPEGIMWPKITDILNHANLNEIRMESEAQINKIFSFGLKPSHLDVHMDLHNYKNLFPIFMKLSSKYNLPMRVWKRNRYKYPIFKNNLISLRKKGFVFPDSQIGYYSIKDNYLTYKERKNKYYEYLRTLISGVHNIKVHIAEHTQELQNILGETNSIIRKIDYDVWTSDETKKLAQDLGIIFIDYRPLQKLQKKLMNK